MIEAAALRFWRDNERTVELLDTRDDDYTLLLERLGAPGTPTLADLGRPRRPAARRGAGLRRRSRT